MTISELIKQLQTFQRKHGDLEVIYQRYSDYTELKDDDVSVVEAVKPMGTEDWLTRTHHTMPEEMKARFKSYLLFPGN